MSLAVKVFLQENISGGFILITHTQSLGIPPVMCECMYYMGGGAYGVLLQDGCVWGWGASQYTYYNKLDYTTMQLWVSVCSGIVCIVWQSEHACLCLYAMLFLYKHLLAVTQCAARKKKYDQVLTGTLFLYIYFLRPPSPPLPPSAGNYCIFTHLKISQKHWIVPTTNSISYNIVHFKRNYQSTLWQTQQCLPYLLLPFQLCVLLVTPYRQYNGWSPWTPLWRVWTSLSWSPCFGLVCLWSSWDCSFGLNSDYWKHGHDHENM